MEGSSLSARSKECMRPAARQFCGSLFALLVNMTATAPPILSEEISTGRGVTGTESD